MVLENSAPHMVVIGARIMGSIRSQRGFLGKTAVGKLSEDATIYSGSGFFSKTVVGEVRDNGAVCAETGFTETVVSVVRSIWWKRCLAIPICPPR